MHREEVTRLRDFARPELPILFEDFHVQSDRDERRLVCATDRRSEAREPCARHRRGRRDHTVGVLVAEVPRPERFMTRECRGGRRWQAELGIADHRIGVPVAKRAFRDLAARDDPEATIAIRTSECPRRNPVPLRSCDR
jgi:hypothetical protein